MGDYSELISRGIPPPTSLPFPRLILVYTHLARCLFISTTEGGLPRDSSNQVFY